VGCCRMAFNNNFKVRAVNRIDGNHGGFPAVVF
jgi:hypothetical protein